MKQYTYRKTLIAGGIRDLRNYGVSVFENYLNFTEI